MTSNAPGRANAIVAMSQGVINIESDLYVNTRGGQGDAIVTRGDAIIAINSSGTHTVQMNGEGRGGPARLYQLLYPRDFSPQECRRASSIRFWRCRHWRA